MNAVVFVTLFIESPKHGLVNSLHFLVGGKQFCRHHSIVRFFVVWTIDVLVEQFDVFRGDLTHSNGVQYLFVYRVFLAKYGAQENVVV